MRDLREDGREDGEAPKVLSGMRKIGGQKTRDAPFGTAETGDQREGRTQRAEKDQNLLGVYQKILHRYLRKIQGVMDMDTGNKFPERLRRLRERTGRKQYAVAECCGVTRRTFRRYELGELEPTRQPIINIADYFDVSADYLLGRTDNPKINK